VLKPDVNHWDRVANFCSLGHMPPVDMHPTLGPV